MMTTDDIARRIREGLADAEVEVRSDDGTHFAALVVSPAFEGLGRLQRHQLVYRSLGTLVGREIHALSITARTPTETGT